jgi:hypothetical protein
MSDSAQKPAAAEWKGVIADGQIGMRKMSPEEIERRGKELRAALHQTYEELVASEKVSGLETDISGYIAPYIFAGITFDDAESILRAAGFSLNPRPPDNQAKNPNKAKDWYAVLARISPFVQRVIGKVSVYVTLFPKSPGDYTVVENVQASFFVSMP